ncbi:MAG: TerC family protein [Chthoniobacteraceae bacterium]
MENFTDPSVWLRLLSIILIDLTLAGDNALVIALAVRSLPPKQQFWGRIWGTLGAVVLRLLFILVIAYALGIPFLQAVGGLILFWIAYKLVQPSGGHGENVRSGTSLFEAVWIIMVADVVMSLDNVLAVAAAGRGHLGLIVFGILLSLPLVVWGSGFLASLMSRFVWIVWLGGGVLGFVAAELVFKDPIIHQWLGGAEALLHHVIPTAAGIFFTALGWILSRRAKGESAGEH